MAGHSLKLRSLQARMQSPWRCALERKKIEVPAEVLTGLEAVRLSGKTNMLDAPRVIELAFEMGHVEAAFWVHDNRSLYAHGIFQGFTSVDPPNNRAPSRHVAQHGASDRTVGKSSQEREPDDTCEGGDNPCVDR